MSCDYRWLLVVPVALLILAALGGRWLYLQPESWCPPEGPPRFDERERRRALAMNRRLIP